jgi:hypothetical protein
VELVDLPVGIAYCPPGGAYGFRALGLKSHSSTNFVAAVHSTSQGNHRNAILPYDFPGGSPKGPLQHYVTHVGSQPVFPISGVVSLYRKSIGDTLKLLKKILRTPDID